MNKIIFLFLLILASCNLNPKSFLVVDREKDNLKGKVKSIEVFAQKEIEIRMWNEAKNPYRPYIDREGRVVVPNMKDMYEDSYQYDTLFKILLEKVFYNQFGNRTEYIRYQVDEELGYWRNSYKDLNQPITINHDVFEHFIYHYVSDLINDVISVDIDSSFINKTSYYFNLKKKIVVDSTFYENGGLLSTSKKELTEFGLYYPKWMSDLQAQFDDNRDILIDGEIHYYYKDYDQYGNWIRLIKYFDGPAKKKSVELIRKIEYY